jgi:serine/threonine protein kinase
VREIQAIREEIMLLKQLNHKNIVKYYFTELTEDMTGKREVQRSLMSLDVGVDIILEYLPGGSIKSLISRFGRLDEGVASLYTRQILEGLAYLHKNGVIHR